MAGVLTLNLTAGLVHGAISQQIFQANGLTIVTNTLGRHAPIVSVGFGGEEDMPIGDVATEGWLLLKNLDSANYVTWGPKSAGVMVPMGRIKATEIAIFRMDSAATLRWQANIADVLVEMYLLPD